MSAKAANVETARQVEAELAQNELYARRAERAKRGKPPELGSGLGTVASIRAPDAVNRDDMIAQIRAQDELESSTGGRFYYKPVTVDGLELKLEPCQPSIGTIVHGIDFAQPLSPTLVHFLRELWLERRALVFRDQGHITREQMVTMAEYFGEVGAPFGEREHVPNSPVDLNQQIKVPGIPDMLVLPSDEDVPNAAAAYHCDATWQPRPPMGSVLMCREAPPVGGDTLFCDCCKCC